MSRLLLPIVLLLLISGASAEAHQSERLPAPVIRDLKSAAIPESAVSVVVRQAGSKLPRISLNANRPMNPASLTKLLTTYAALKILGPAYTWKTEAWVDGQLEHGRLDGNLYLKGGGDPILTFERFWLLLRSLRARGVRDIRGNLVLDRSLFAVNDSGIFDDHPLRPYNVHPDALLLNFKAIRLALVPGLGGKPVAVLPRPLPAGVGVDDRVRLDAGGCRDWEDGLRAHVLHRGSRTHLIVSGTYPGNCGEKDWEVSILSHPQYVYGVFRELWHELGGTLAGGLREGPVPATARLVASTESPPLAVVIRDVNKYSNNVMADQIFLTMAAASGERPATVAGARATLLAWLAHSGLRLPELRLKNGSGLSRRGRVSAAGLSHLLAAAWRDPLMPEFVASLPLVGVDGTMEKRLVGEPAAGQAHIKTGSIDGVKGIAGYVRDRTGKWQIVVFMVNCPNAAAAWVAQDALLEWVYRHGA